MRGIGQGTSIPRPCEACKPGLDGRAYCPTCGNTVDNEGGFHYREMPLDQQPRSSKEVTQALGGFLNVKVGVTYRVTIELAPDRFKTIVGKCLHKAGPMATFAPNYNITILEIKEISLA